MIERSVLERRIIAAVRDILDVTETTDPDSDAMRDEIQFVRLALDRWEQHGAEAAAGFAGAMLRIARSARQERQRKQVA